MKRIFIFALITCALLSGCKSADIGIIGGADGPTSIIVANKTVDDWGITMYAEDVTPTGVKVICIQSGGFYKGELQTGTPWTLEYKDNGEWQEYPTKDGNPLVWTMIAQAINKNDVVEWYMDFSMHYDPLPQGEYRVGKVVTDFRGAGDYASRTYYANFTIEAE